MKNMEFMLIIVLIVSLAYPFHPVSGRGVVLLKLNSLTRSSLR